MYTKETDTIHAKFRFLLLCLGSMCAHHNLGASGDVHEQLV